jgi:cobalt-zinc-cadmium efflux system membrane fusion protein
VTGRVELNADRVAHVGSPTEGITREILVDLGAEVEAGDVLAYIDSREVGRAKLAMVQARLERDIAASKLAVERTVHDNTRDLLTALREGQTAAAIEQAFRDRPVGAYREQLMAALSRKQHAAAEYERLEVLDERSIVAGKQLIRARAEHEAAAATFQGLVEQIGFDSRQHLLSAQQRVEEAETALAVARSQLMILGYEAGEIDAMDPIGEGARVAYYRVTAPFSGTVVSKHAAKGEHVDAHEELFTVADLSTVWLRADVFERDLSATDELEGTGVKFRTASYPAREFAARVFSRGHVVDDATRAVPLLAVAENRDGRLRPGMFVEINLEGSADQDVLIVPTAAVQRHENQPFVFVALRSAGYERRDVTLGRSAGERVEIVGGLDEGESVVVEGGFALKSELLSDLMAEE